MSLKADSLLKTLTEPEEEMKRKPERSRHHRFQFYPPERKSGSIVSNTYLTGCGALTV